ncbi:hypothetical protein [Clostridium botulinum]|uniref:hypothetical protein n=1 Tax=Clostridium botulinum TaxID=1491 RepID=UPI001E626F11|nr:hypothetical protein [Clostridium botulinum]
MLVSKEVKVKWNGYTRKWYESKGYKWTRQNDYFLCKIEDLQPTSTIKVDVKCDYCGSVHKKEYRSYLLKKDLINKDCCKLCKNKKQEEIMTKKYGVKNISQLEDRKKISSEQLRTPFKQVMDFCSKKGLTLLSTEQDYKNDRSKLRFKCNFHEDYGIQESNFANIKKSKHCCKYGGYASIGEVKRLDGEFIYNEFINKGLIPKFKAQDYKDNMQLLPYFCPKHKDKGIQLLRYGNLQQGQRCAYCANEHRGAYKRFNEDDVFLYFQQRGLRIVEGEKYKNKEQHIKYICCKHPQDIQIVTYSGLKNTVQPCKYCRAEDNITLLNKRYRSSIGFWRKRTEKECNYKCILTGNTQYDIHHLYSYNSIIKDAMVNLKIPISNKIIKDGKLSIQLKEEIKRLHKIYKGVCIHSDLHILFHIEYGKENNIENQFEEFKKRYYNGEFDDKLKEELKSYNSMERVRNIKGVI